MVKGGATTPASLLLKIALFNLFRATSSRRSAITQETNYKYENWFKKREKPAKEEHTYPTKTHPDNASLPD
jgi:hypothetical protein